MTTEREVRLRDRAVERSRRASRPRATTRRPRTPSSNRPLAPSQGFNQSQRVNIGALENRGWEASIKYLVVSRARFDWTTGVNLDGNKNKVTDLGGVTLAGNAVRIGYPVQGSVGAEAERLQRRDDRDHVRQPADHELGVPDDDAYRGRGVLRSAAPDVQRRLLEHGALGLVLALRPRLDGDAVPGSATAIVRIASVRAAPTSTCRRSARTASGRSRPTRSSSGRQHPDPLRQARQRASARGLAQLAGAGEAQLDVPHRAAPAMSLAGQNLMWWDDCHCVDPNMNWAGADSYTIGSGFLAQPSPRQFRLQIRTRF